jgi:hypothetical protein
MKDLLIEWAPYIIATMTPVVADIIAGAIPDRWVPYIGACRRVARKAWKIYKEGKPK